MIRRRESNGFRAAAIQILFTGTFAALSAYVAIKVGLTEVRANQISMNSRLDRVEAKLDRVVEKVHAHDVP